VGDQVGLFTPPARLVAGNDGINTWTSPGIELDPDTTYLLGVISGGADPHIVRNASTKVDDAGGLAGWSVVDDHRRRTRGGSSYSDVEKNLKMRFYGHVFGGAETPTPGTLISNTGQTGADILQFRTYNLAQRFMTGPNPAGYTLTSVAFQFGSVVDAPETYRASIHTVSGSNPGR